MARIELPTFVSRAIEVLAMQCLVFEMLVIAEEAVAHTTWTSQ